LFIVGLGCAVVSALCFSGGFILFLGIFISFEVCASLHLSMVVLVLGRFFLSKHECYESLGVTHRRGSRKGSMGAIVSIQATCCLNKNK
jgi:membrane protein implicated in regulation of membrane protease activity